MQTKARKRVLLGATITERSKFMAEGRRVFLNALNQQIEPFLDHLEHNASIYPQLILSSPIEKAFQVIYGSVGAYFAQRTLNSAKNRKSLDIQLKRRRRRFVSNPDGTTVEIIENETWLEYMRRFASERMGEKIVGITETTQKFVQDALKETIDQGLGVEKSAKLIREKWADVSKVRARRIAQTEIIGASNAGSLQGALATGLDMDKVWLAKVVNSRPDHLAAHRQKVNINDTFSIGGSRMAYPGDPSGNVGQVVNCHCTLIYEVRD